MSHKYDEFYRLLVDAHVVTARAVREAEALGLKGTLDEIKDLYNGLVKVSNNVMTKIESDHIAGLIDASGAPPLSTKLKFGENAWEQAAADPRFNRNYKSVRAEIAQHNPHYGVTPQLMYVMIDEERNCDATGTEGLTETAPDTGCGPTD